MGGIKSRGRVESLIMIKHGGCISKHTSCLQKTNCPIDKSQMYAAFIQCMRGDTMVEGNQIQKASLASCELSGARFINMKHQ